MNKHILWLALALGSVALAQSPGTPITSLPAATQPYAGSEILPGIQAGSGPSCSGGFCGVGFSLANLKTYFGTPTGAVTVTGSPLTGNIVAWSGPSSITNGNFFGDCTTGNTFQITCTKTNGVSFAPSATTDTTNATNITGGTLPNGRLNATLPVSITGLAGTATSLAATPSQCSGGQFATGVTATGAANCGTPSGSGNVSTSGSITTGSLPAWASGTTLQTSNLSGDCTTSNSLVITCTKTSGSAFGTFATQNVATPPAIGTGTPNTGAFSGLTVGGLKVGYLGAPLCNSGAALTANYTLALADESKQCAINISSGITITIPANSSVAFPADGTACILLINWPTSTANATLTITTDTMYWMQGGSTANRTLLPGAHATLCKFLTTSWWVDGSNIT